jgi:hypothetical protein
VAFLRFIFLLFIASTALHFGWEISQMPLYSFTGVSAGDYQAFVKAHWIAAAKDGLITVALYFLVAIFLQNMAWGRRFSNRRIVFLLSFGFLWAVAMEYHAVFVRHAWSYAKAMPLLPGIGLGISPILQMMVVPLIAIILVRRQLSEK